MTPALSAKLSTAIIKRSRQWLFTRSGRHLMWQGKRAAEAIGTCKYRVRNTNLSCAVGCLIPDSAYTPRMEGRTVAGSLGQLIALPREGSPKYNLLVDLQHVHDRHEPETWYAQLREIAARYGLSMQGIPSTLGAAK